MLLAQNPFNARHTRGTTHATHAQIQKMLIHPSSIRSPSLEVGWSTVFWPEGLVFVFFLFLLYKLVAVVEGGLLCG
jgi:hypothetical protein